MGVVGGNVLGPAVGGDGAAPASERPMAFSPSWIPKLNSSCRHATSGLNRRGSKDLGDKRGLVVGEEAFDARLGRDERTGEVWEWRCADDDQQGDAVAHDGVTFVRLVTDATIVGERDPAALSDRLQPRLIRRIWRKMISMRLHRQAARPENVREAFAEITIGEIDKTHAARS